MKVFYINSYSCIGGAEKSLQSIIVGVKERGIEPLLVCGENGDLISWCKSENIKYYILKQPSLQQSNFLKRLFNFFIFNVKLIFLMLKERTNVLHTNTLRSRVYCFLIAALPFVRSIAHVRDIEHIEHQSRLVSSYNTTIAISKAVKDSIVQNLDENLDENVTLVYNAVDDYSNAEPLYVKGQNKSVFNVAMFGRFDDWKGQHLFIECANLMLTKGFEARFYIFGDAIRKEELDYKKKCLSLIYPSNKSDVVHVGFVSEPYRYMRSLDLIVCPSINEPFGRVAIEAISAKTIFIASNGGGLPEILGDIGKQCLFKEGDVDDMSNKINQVYTNLDMYKGISSELFLRYKVKFHMDKLLDRLVVFYS
ncbi:glycosyltransferase [Aliivibrio fischeri]|uniref:glycosyltransferase n=1 Tax=Aliivibrio fischeri TaxID=668 RepID=UPI001F21E9B1|nr:glycosyltransferase [Aliivibrio fischeri]MCE7536797.1 glycosyltransferase [Aliivibrio fischeri]MCE7560487.1 glycosyltransferase [Aliivibrio fischeri]